MFCCFVGWYVYIVSFSYLEEIMKCIQLPYAIHYLLAICKWLLSVLHTSIPSELTLENATLCYFTLLHATLRYFLSISALLNATFRYLSLLFCLSCLCFLLTLSYVTKRYHPLPQNIPARNYLGFADGKNNAASQLLTDVSHQGDNSQ